MENLHQAAEMMDTSGDINMVEHWIHVDRTRWIAGIVAGAFAGIVALIFAGVLAKVGGNEFTFPAKLMATPFLGAEATNYSAGIGPVIVGILFWELLSVFWGTVYAHFTYTNSLPALLGMGLAWTALAWIFLWNLFFQSWSTIYTAAVPSSAVFFICLVYGLSLTSVAAFDRAFRR